MRMMIYVEKESLKCFRFIVSVTHLAAKCYAVSKLYWSF